jgi:hypothetical protein
MSLDLSKFLAVKTSQEQFFFWRARVIWTWNLNLKAMAGDTHTSCWYPSSKRKVQLHKMKKKKKNQKKQCSIIFELKKNKILLPCLKQKRGYLSCRILGMGDNFPRIVGICACLVTKDSRPTFWRCLLYKI